MRIAVIGGGGWGLALAKLLSENKHEVLVWEFNPAYLDILRTTHTNPQLLKGIQLPAAIRFTSSMDEVVGYSPEIVVLATPAQFVRKTIQNTPPALWLSPHLKAIVNVAKGIEEGSLQTLDKVLQETLPKAVHPIICALSGPSHAEEVARKVPTTVVIAGSDDKQIKQLQEVFSSAYFRVYRSDDLIGVEIGGAVKNIISIAAGIVSGLGYGDNTIGALLTRGVVEISRLGIAMNAQAETFLGLSGIGDLITTATSPHSRNRYVGVEIGKGRKLPEILAEMSMVAEGVATTRSVHFLALKLNVDMPIVHQVYQILFEAKDPKEAITELMTRELKAE
ncbi:MAG: NAD(P)-dependent glycerol-3-phosphate dehydrogenase [Candidatus Cloacimonetes bacterium]|nr:NAD(P)-dependent glycerol-3-phosphate dehydrogenase [Candidatus Cloacimonadota bacterium]